MVNRFDRDIYHYGSMRDFKHREALKHVDWGMSPACLRKAVSSMVFVCFGLLCYTCYCLFSNLSYEYGKILRSINERE